MPFRNTLSFPLKIKLCKNHSLISRARNNLIAKAMNNPDKIQLQYIIISFIVRNK